MQTRLAQFIKDTPQGETADGILRKCVHCGFCNATCPTYLLLGDELDGPRGRIYLIKQMLEGQEVSAKTQLHLDRCLTCLNCQTTCPSGVEYGKLLDIGREVMEQKVSRPLGERIKRRALRAVLPHAGRFNALLSLAQGLRPLLPPSLKTQVPPRRAPDHRHQQRTHPRKVLMLEGCVQPALSPAINDATSKVLDALGIEIVAAKGAGCCGALSHHLSATEEALGFMKRNIDAWWPHIEAGAEAIVSNISGCGLVVKQYGEHLKDIPDYAHKARRVAEMSKDLSELIGGEDTDALKLQEPRKIAFHPPCTLQHGQKLTGAVERILSKTGFELVAVQDAHLCCGSAGTYSILQAELSRRLLQDKLEKLQRHEPNLIATANIGCLAHLRSEAKVPVVHWIELLADLA
jgi:glycolate oxidase iron-sulfur subunit